MDDNKTDGIQGQYKELNRIRTYVLRNVDKIMQSNREDVLDAMRTAINVLKTARDEGIDSVIDIGRNMEKDKNKTKQFYASVLNIQDIVFETAVSRMLEMYYDQPRNMVDDFIYYIYMRSMPALHSGLGMYVVKNIYSSMLPPQERFCMDGIMEG